MKRTSLKRKTPLQGGKRLRQVSTKKAQQLIDERKTKRRLVELTHGLCEARVEAVCVGRGTDKHERKTRARGGDPTDLSNVALVCRPCHDWIDDHPREAQQRGLLVSQHDKEASA